RVELLALRVGRGDEEAGQVVEIQALRYQVGDEHRAFAAGGERGRPGEVALSDLAFETAVVPGGAVALEAAVEGVGRRIGHGHAEQWIQFGEVAAGERELRLEGLEDEWRGQAAAGMGAGGAGPGAQVEAAGVVGVAQLERRFGTALEAEPGATPAPLALELDRRRGVLAARLEARAGDVDAVGAARVVVAQAAVADPRAAQVERLAVACDAEVPVAGPAFWMRFGPHIRCVQAQFGQAHAADEQRPQFDLQGEPFGRRHVLVLRPAGVTQPQLPGRDRGQPAQVDVEVAADVETAPGPRLDDAFDRALEPVPVPQQYEHRDRRDGHRNGQCERAPRRTAPAMPRLRPS